jgi:gluconolactonase
MNTLSIITAPALLLAASGSLATAGPAFEIRDADAFAKCVDTTEELQQLATGMKFTEGPAWLERDGGFLVFSDIPADELKKWTAKDGLTSFRQPSRNTNGNTVDPQGRLVSCEHGGRQLSRLAADGSLEVLVDRWEGKRFNSPNDAVVARDGTIYFTDPDYGLAGRPREIDGNWVFRFQPQTRELRVLAKDFDKPNGIALSPDGKLLYVADSGRSRHIRVFKLTANGDLAEGKVFCTIDQGAPDGIRCDSEGRIWSSAGDGAQVFAPDGKLLGKILVPQSPANLCFGGPDGHILFLTARTSLYSIKVRAHATRPAP